MPIYSISRTRLFSIGFLVAFGLAGTGCREEPGISHYKHEKAVQSVVDNKGAIPHKEIEGGVPTRYLTAIVPQAADSWFFKLMGDPEELAKIEPAFQKFIASLKFPKDGKSEPTWEFPEGWTQGPPRQMRIATLLIPSGDKKLELSVTRFGGDLKINIDRWRRELGLPELTSLQDEEYKKTVKEITVDGQKTYVIDIQGVKKPGSGMPPFMKN